MPGTPLTEVLRSAGAAIGEYRGIATALRFAGVAAEFHALNSGCGVYDLGWRAQLFVTGDDRARWLNGMVTNNIKDLALDRGAYSFLLSAQGRIQADMYIYNRGEHLVVDTDCAQAAKVLEIFEKFIIMDDVEVSNRSGEVSAIGLRGPLALRVLQAAGIPCRALAPLEVADTAFGTIGISVVRAGERDRNAYEIWMAPAHAPALWRSLTQAGATPVGTDALELARIAAGVPRYGQDIRERDLPQETEQQQALNFQKGCYVGQEIVERIRSRGLVHRMFTGFTFSGATPAAGTRIEAEGRYVGEITSVASLPVAGGRSVGLGYIRREAGAPGAEININGATAKVTALPFEFS